LPERGKTLALRPSALGNLGNIAGEVEGDQERALALYQEQLEIAKSVADKTNQAIASWNVSVTHWKQGSKPEAIRYGREASRLYEETNDARAEKVREVVRRWEG
jgi:tetratricopeptide (TPR) repeat protein